jgi:hypothetical protein
MFRRMNRAVFLGSLMTLCAGAGLPGRGGGASQDGISIVETDAGATMRPVFSAAELEGLLRDSQQNAPAAGVTARLVAPGFTRAAPDALRIQEFALDVTMPNYQGFVEVPDSPWLDGQRDFYGSESQDLLRVMTAEYTPDQADSIDLARYARNDIPWSTSWSNPEQLRGLF